jgi:hypothetical protein
MQKTTHRHFSTHKFISCFRINTEKIASVLCASFVRQLVRMISGDFDTNLIESNREEVTSIDKLPTEVLLEVFALLDNESLLNACLVCKSWENLIGASNVTMKKFKLKLDPQRVQERFDGSSYWRKHVNVDVFYGHVFDSIVSNFEHFDLTQVKKLQIYGPEAVDIQKLMKFLSQMPLVEDIYFQPSTISYSRALLTDAVTFPHLRILKIDSVTCNALQFFNARSLSVLDINGYRVPSDQDVTTLEKFLNISENLKKLKINEHMFTRIFGKETQPQFKFDLEKFEMSYQCKTEAVCDRNFNKFLRTQSNLIDLDIHLLENISSATFATIVTLPKLAHLKLDVSSTPSSRQFFEKLRPNISVKTLQIRGDFPSDEAAKGFFKSFPNVELIQLQEDIEDHINFVAMYNKRLEELRLSSISSEVFDESTFDNLKSIEINYLRDTNAWMSLVEKSPSLETFSLGSIESDLILRPEVEFLLHQPRLRNLKLDGDYEFVETIFNILKGNYGSLKTLNLIMSETSDYGTTMTAEVQFEFPDDVSQWSIEAAEAKFDKAWDYRSW